MLEDCDFDLAKALVQCSSGLYEREWKRALNFSSISTNAASDIDLIESQQQELENTETQAAAAADAVAPSCDRCNNDLGGDGGCAACTAAGYAPARGHGFALSSERQRPPAEPRSPHEPRCRGTTLRREEDHNVDAKPNQGHCGSDHQLVKPAGDGHREDQRFHMEGMEEIDD